MRITAGAYRGRKLVGPEGGRGGTGRGGKTHPMGSRERLALFNMVAAQLDLAEARVLDAFAGTGALGLEALSRGAAEVVFVERDARALAALKTNVANLGVEDKVEVVKGAVGKYDAADAAAAADADADADAAGFDLVLVDPPYDKFETAEFEHLRKLLRPGGVMVVSHPAGNGKAEFDAEEFAQRNGLVLQTTRKYAGAEITVYRAGQLCV